MLSEMSDNECLAEWARQFDISRTAVTSLLHLLHRYQPSLPIDGRTLLHTPRSTAVKEMAGMVQQISERLFALKDYLPCEFARRPRSLYEVDR